MSMRVETVGEFPPPTDEQVRRAAKRAAAAARRAVREVDELIGDPTQELTDRDLRALLGISTRTRGTLDEVLP